MEQSVLSFELDLPQSQVEYSAFLGVQGVGVYTI